MNPVSKFISKEAELAHGEIGCVNGRVEAERPSQAWCLYSCMERGGIIVGVDHGVMTKGLVSALAVDRQRDWEVDFVFESSLRTEHADDASLLTDAPEVYADMAGFWEK